MRYTDLRRILLIMCSIFLLCGLPSYLQAEPLKTKPSVGGPKSPVKPTPKPIPPKCPDGSTPTTTTQTCYVSETIERKESCEEYGNGKWKPVCSAGCVMESDTTPKDQVYNPPGCDLTRFFIPLEEINVTGTNVCEEYGRRRLDPPTKKDRKINEDNRETLPTYFDKESCESAMDDPRIFLPCPDIEIECPEDVEVEQSGCCSAQEIEPALTPEAY